METCHECPSQRENYYLLPVSASVFSHQSKLPLTFRDSSWCSGQKHQTNAKLLPSTGGLSNSNPTLDNFQEVISFLVGRENGPFAVLQDVDVSFEIAEYCKTNHPESTTVVLGHRQLLVTKIYLGKQYMTMIQPPDPGSHSSGLGGTPVTFNFS